MMYIKIQNANDNSFQHEVVDHGTVSRRRWWRAADGGGGLMAQWQRAAGMPTVVWSHGLYLCTPLFPLSHPPPGCFSPSLSSSPPSSLFTPSLPPFSSAVYGRQLLCLRWPPVYSGLCVFAQTTVRLKIMAPWAPHSWHTDLRTAS